jgi:hypothetical protein
MRPAFFPLLALLAPLLLAAPAVSQPVQPLDRLLPEVRRNHPGQFYDADGPHPGAGGSQHYHLKWMTPEGRIIWYDMDARTGRVLGTSPGRDNFDGRGENPYRGYGGRGGYEDRRGYDRRGDDDDGPRRGRSRFRGDPEMGNMGGFGNDFGGRWSGPRVDGPRGNGQVWGGPGFNNRNFGGSFGPGGRYRMPDGNSRGAGRGRRER